eukprot:CAMPEP_0114272976 /NCGR_PEP_ID=MMETSP0058-20121206/28823_1 /TAXON_ID=36894 /ORGANISM="Pyramimonas parkeae, CCMP726" /LENGTH=167 /DNA_ID=CAMNT_0001392345 /DNA_START=2594 /DNA_END=3098 /DNA_ORIENTATION=-
MSLPTLLTSLRCTPSSKQTQDRLAVVVSAEDVGTGGGELVNVGWGVGWRRTHHLVAAAGLALALVLALIVQEPDRPANAKSASSGANRGLEALSNVFAEPATRWLFAAGGARYFGGLALVVFMPEFYRRTFPSYAAAFSVLNAVVLVLGGAMSAVAGGHLVDKVLCT